MQQDADAPTDEILEIPVELALVPYLAGAAARLSYTEPSLALEIFDSSLRVTTRRPTDQLAITRKINHALYREKVRAESAPLRARFLELLSHR